MGKKLLLLGAILTLALFLRLYDLPSLPNGLHWDEQDTGYQAYSLLRTGKDYFGNPLPLFVHSLADYRTPVFIYTAVPFVAQFGLTAFSVRLPSVIWGLLSIILVYYLANLLFPGKKWLGHIAALVLTLSPWHVLYGRQSVECNSMLPLILLGVVAFYKALTNPHWLWVSALGFALAIAAYSPAKLFVPLLMLVLIIMHRPKLHLLPVLLFLCLAGPILYSSTFGPAGTRFHDVSITTDPTIAAYVDQKRLEHAVSSGRPRTVGMQPTLLDELISNKPKVIWDNFISNYTRTFSLDYLFLTGDQNLRQSPSQNSIGQFHLLELIPFLLGAYLIAKKRHLILISWLLLGPIASSLTRDGGPHAARTFLMLPAFVLLISLGIYHLAHKSKLLLAAYGLLYLISSIFIFDYFFSYYRFESAKPFQWGFDRVVNLAVANSSKYDQVFVDLHQDSGLMAYLFTTRFDPAKFQAMQPIPTTTILPEVTGTAFGNIVFLNPGVRFWIGISDNTNYHGKNLIISAADQPLLDQHQPKLGTINYPDSTPAFYLLELFK